MLKELLEARNITPIWNTKQSWEERQQELLSLLCEHEYGKIEKQEQSLSWKVTRENPEAFSGKASMKITELTAHFDTGDFSFPCISVIPKAAEKVPFFVYIGFGKGMPDWNLPMEEILDRGYGLLTFNYQDVAVDFDMQKHDPTPYSIGAYPFLQKDVDKKTYGHIAVWAWGASKVMDYACSMQELDITRAAIVGHSRLGKTALYAGAIDSRFSYVIPNDSGCGGAALYRGIKGENLSAMAVNFPYWMCGKYQNYIDDLEGFPLDQHMVLASIAPRKIYVSAASEDIWADYDSMYLACAAASEVYEKMGLPGFVSPDRLPETGDVFQEGNIGFHLRKGPHNIGREDWQHFMDFIDKH